MAKAAVLSSGCAARLTAGALARAVVTHPIKANSIGVPGIQVKSPVPRIAVAKAKTSKSFPAQAIDPPKLSMQEWNMTMLLGLVFIVMAVLQLISFNGSCKPNITASLRCCYKI